MGRLPVPLPVVLPLLFRFRLQRYVSLDLSTQDCGTYQYCSSVMLVLAPCFTVGDVPVSCLRRSYICLLRRGILALASYAEVEAKALLSPIPSLSYRGSSQAYRSCLIFNVHCQHWVDLETSRGLGVHSQLLAGK